MNVIISRRNSNHVIARYEIHLAEEEDPKPSEQHYFDEAWDKAVGDRLVRPERRTDYEFQLQRPKTLYESST